jgi:hypothetical protein
VRAGVLISWTVLGAALALVHRAASAEREHKAESQRKLAIAAQDFAAASAQFARAQALLSAAPSDPAALAAVAEAHAGLDRVTAEFKAASALGAAPVAVVAMASRGRYQ